MNKYQFPVTTAYEPTMGMIPMLITFPRSGTHFLRFLLKNYFNKDGLSPGVIDLRDPISISKISTNFMWFHDHDSHCLSPSFNKVLYLYRNPTAVISSLTYVEKSREVNKKYCYEEIIIVLTNMYKKHLKKYLINYPTKVFAIQYEKLLSDKRYDEFEIVCNYFNTNINKNKFDNIYKNATKNTVIKQVIKKNSNKYYGKFLLSKDYENYKINFKEKYSTMINDIIFNNNINLKKFFRKIEL